MDRPEDAPYTPSPTTIFYLIAGFRTQVQFVRYDWNETHYQNFLDLVRHVREALRANVFPKVYGKACFDCDFQPMCYGFPNHRKLYRKKKKHVPSAADKSLP